VNATTDSAAVFGSSRSTVGHHQNGNDLGIVSGTSEIFAHQELFPTSTYSTAFIGGNTVIGDTFSNPNDIYGMGDLGHNAGIDGAFLATMVMSLDVVGTEDLMIGFFDVASSGNGFETFGMSIKMEGATVLSQSFGTLASATAFFDNQVYSLGDLSTIDGPLDLEISWAVNTTALDSFSSRFVFGNETITMLGPMNFTAVPEPSTILFLGLLGTTAVLRRRRR
jgi:hypothetical protein